MGILKKIKNEEMNFFLATSLCVLVSTRLITFVAFPNPISSPDSPTYFSGRFLDFSLVSFSGNASRGWPVPFFYAIMPNSRSLEIFQLIFSGIAWCFLLLAISAIKLMPKRPLNYLILMLALLGSSSQVIQHDTSVLSTSITNTFFILLICFLIRTKFFVGSKLLNLFSGMFCSAMLMIQKTSFIPIAFSLSLLLIWSFQKQISKYSKLFALGLLFFLTSYAILIGNNVNSNWQISYSGQTLLWHLGGQSPTAAEFSSHLRNQNAPRCLTTEAPYEDLNSSIGKILNSCPEARSYLKSRIQRDFIGFILEDPGSGVKLAIHGMGASLTSSANNYGNAVSIVPKFFEGLFFGTTTPELVSQKLPDQVAGMNLFRSGSAFWLFTPFLGWIFLALISSVFRGRERRQDLALYSILTICLMQSVLVVVLLPSEWVRQTSPFVIGALIISIILTFKNIHATSSIESKRGIKSVNA
jgi:hypothetical protein